MLWFKHFVEKWIWNFFKATIYYSDPCFLTFLPIFLLKRHLPFDHKNKVENYTILDQSPKKNCGMMRSSPKTFFFLFSTRCSMRNGFARLFYFDGWLRIIMHFWCAATSSFSYCSNFDDNGLSQQRKPQWWRGQIVVFSLLLCSFKDLIIVSVLFLFQFAYL